MPRGANFAGEIAETNELSRAFAATRTTVQYLDLWPALADPNNALRTELTFDGLHLNGRGYTTWVEVLRPLVNRHRQAAAPQSAAE
jgi:lysophospholipase L1-like esterase